MFTVDNSHISCWLCQWSPLTAIQKKDGRRAGGLLLIDSLFSRSLLLGQTARDRMIATQCNIVGYNDDVAASSLDFCTSEKFTAKDFEQLSFFMTLLMVFLEYRLLDSLMARTVLSSEFKPEYSVNIRLLIDFISPLSNSSSLVTNCTVMIRTEQRL